NQKAAVSSPTRGAGNFLELARTTGSHRHLRVNDRRWNQLALPRIPARQEGPARRIGSLRSENLFDVCDGHAQCDAVVSVFGDVVAVAGGGAGAASAGALDSEKDCGPGQLERLVRPGSLALGMQTTSKPPFAGIGQFRGRLTVPFAATPIGVSHTRG